MKRFCWQFNPFDLDSDDTSPDEDVDGRSGELESYEEEEKDQDGDDDGVNLFIDTDTRVESKANDGISLRNTTNKRLYIMRGVRDDISPDSEESYFVVHIDGRRE